ncbi:MAG: hypothetical protein RR248_02495 [Clostridia bacterium]
MKTQVNQSVKAIIVITLVAFICVGLLAVLNDLLYVPPDMSLFEVAYKAEYVPIEVDKNIKTTAGKVIACAEGTTSEGKVMGLYIEGKKSGKTESFVILIVIDMTSNNIVGVYLKYDGSTGGYAFDKTLLNNMIGKTITSPTVFNNSTDIIQAGVTSSPLAARNCFIVAAEYYCAKIAAGVK